MVQAAIAACHALAPSYDETDWDAIVSWYDVLLTLDSGPVVRLVRRAPQSGADERDALFDPRGVPAGAVLVAEEHGGAVGVDPRGPAGVLQQHQRQQPEGTRVVGSEPHQQPGQPHGLVDEVVADEIGAGRGGVPLVEDEVRRREHRRPPLGQLGLGRHPVGDVGLLDLLAG